jgi:hypothetical protein
MPILPTDPIPMVLACLALATALNAAALALLARGR